MLQRGDFETIWPLYKMYVDRVLPVHRLRSELHFTHDGATIPETVSWYGTRRAQDVGSWQNYQGMGRMPLWFHQNSAVRNHFACSLELTFLAIQHWRFAPEAEKPRIARSVIQPLGLDLVTWYSKHYMLGGVNNALTSPEPPPLTSTWGCATFNCTCQGLANYFGVIAGAGFGCTDAEAVRDDSFSICSRPSR